MGGGVVAALVVIGASATDHIGQPSLTIPRSDSARATALTRDQFGGTISMAVLLEGPPAVVERRGPQIVAELQKVKGVQVL